jgi:hypothetical protein
MEKTIQVLLNQITESIKIQIRELNHINKANIAVTTVLILIILILNIIMAVLNYYIIAYEIPKRLKLITFQSTSELIRSLNDFQKQRAYFQHQQWIFFNQLQHKPEQDMIQQEENHVDQKSEEQENIEQVDTINEIKKESIFTFLTNIIKN